MRRQPSKSTTLSPKNQRVHRALLRHQNLAAVPSIEDNNNTDNLRTTRFRYGDYVLVRDNNSNLSSSNLVNRYGFPPGRGDTLEERRGPYAYTLCTVKQVHYEEMIPYYTVTRVDTRTDERADADYMEAIKSIRGERAALRAATCGDVPDDFGMDAPHQNAPNALLDICACPFVWMGNVIRRCLNSCLFPCLRNSWACTINQSRLFLNGKHPYICRIRLTMVNLVVLCSIWFLLSDQARLAFFPPEADYVLAIVNFCVWLVLFIELFLELFIRPLGYSDLIHSDKAFSPSTVRFIDGFHLVIETFSLAIFVPEFLCLFTDHSCGERFPFSVYNGFILGIIGPDIRHLFYGHAFIALIRLRVFALVRHWKNMWITNKYITANATTLDGMVTKPGTIHELRQSIDSKASHIDQAEAEKRWKEWKEAELTSAATIGTALMATNSHRALASVWAIVGLFPLVLSLCGIFGNHVAEKMTYQLQASNVLANDTSNSTCEFYTSTINSWIRGIISGGDYGASQPFLLTLIVEPTRCGFSSDILTNFEHANESLTTEKSAIREGSILEYEYSQRGSMFIEELGLNRTVTYSVQARFDMTAPVRTAAVSSLLLQFCLLGMILGGISILRRDSELLALGPLRRMLKIVARYARNPLVQPKMTRKASPRHRIPGRHNTSTDDDESSSSDLGESPEAASLELGSYETEQLLTAVAKITDLLRKCWGVAGADIISTNLSTREGALTEVFNPTVPGKSVYALFAFATIGGFDNAVRNLGDDVMPLINDVANVLHGEVFRWGFGDSGQCNKNLGGSFLMVFRIGLVKEVIEKLEQATDVVFSTGTSSSKSPHGSNAFRRRQNRRQSSLKSSDGSSGYYSDRSSSNVRSSVGTLQTSGQKRRSQASQSQSINAMSLSLQSLPGISTFTDRAVIGMLKSYAGIYRDKRVLGWNEDFRLGAGVGAFRITMMFGMDAGYAVEGAVGSEYKIDATYLSPHVNMASRMTSACKQYNVTIMLSQSVQELMSDTARHKLRHLDTVTVKGSSVKQKIYTYDARARGVDFFLHSRAEDSADAEADRYTEKIWNEDIDLISMRQHVTDDFLMAFREGHKAYLSGDWPLAIQKLQKANDIMFQTAVEEGYMEDEFDALNLRPGEDVRGAAEEQKLEHGDGPSMYLINFMKSQGGVAPPDWDGWRPLIQK